MCDQCAIRIRPEPQGWVVRRRGRDLAAFSAVSGAVAFARSLAARAAAGGEPPHIFVQFAPAPAPPG